jgi:NADH pyrophosphatase NudC (nudix superfamily)
MSKPKWAPRGGKLIKADEKHKHCGMCGKKIEPDPAG